MAAGLPVVTTAVGGLPTVIDDGETGYLTAVDERAFAAALAKLLDDPAAARAMGLRARAVALGRYSAERMCDDYLALYQRALRR
jgi:glycosyltransferase involved in cell wall biosynthesis